MKRTLIIAGMLGCQPVFASCEKLEFAELQSKSKPQLERRYCQSLMDAGFATKRFDLALKYRDYPEVDAQKEEADRCGKEAVRAFEQLNKRFKSAKPPDCAKMHGEHWNPEWNLDSK